MPNSLSSHDGLHRLKELDRGDLTGTPPTGITAATATPQPTYLVIAQFPHKVGPHSIASYNR